MKKRRDLTAEELAVAARLRAIYESKKRSEGLTQEVLADITGLTQSAVTQYLNGKIALNLAAIFAFAKSLKVDAREIDPTLDLSPILSPDEQRLIQRYRASGPKGREILMGAAALAPEYDSIAEKPQ